MKEFITLNELSIWEIHALLKRSIEFKNNSKQVTLNASVANCFYEPSTRTHYSFLAAEQRLGMHTMDLNPQICSELKGETVQDTLRTLKHLGTDCVVLRHSDEKILEDRTDFPKVINAGIAKDEHPTQALLDLLTIFELKQEIKKLNISMIGDIKHSRVAKSDSQILQRLGANLFYVSPKQYYEPFFEQWGSYICMEEALRISDVIIVLRNQLERHSSEFQIDLNLYAKEFGMNIERVNKTKNTCMIMHPGPIHRNVEMSNEVINHPQCYYEKQIRNGIYSRMAVLEAVCS